MGKSAIIISGNALSGLQDLAKGAQATQKLWSNVGEAVAELFALHFAANSGKPNRLQAPSTHFWERAAIMWPQRLGMTA